MKDQDSNLIERHKSNDSDPEVVRSSMLPERKRTHYILILASILVSLIATQEGEGKICNPELGCKDGSSIQEDQRGISGNVIRISNRNMDDQTTIKFKPNDLHLLFEFGKNFTNSRQLEMTNMFFYQNDSRVLPINISFSHLSYGILETKLMVLSYSDFFTHRYDDIGDSKRAAGPQINQELCLRQLEHLNARARTHIELKSKSNDSNFAHYMDTFGGSPTGLLIGNWFWIGSYEACRRMQIWMPGDEKYSAARYCIGSLRYKDWPIHDPFDEILTLKTGICLPESCDSVDYKNKFQLIKQLNDYHARQADDSDAMELTSVYCLPDDKSEMRMWWRSRPTLITIMFTCLWILILVAATIVDEIAERRREKRSREMANVENGLEISPVRQTNNKLERVCKSLSIGRNLRSIFFGSSIDRTHADDKGDHKQQVAELNKPVTDKIIKLDVLEGIKVLAMIYVMSGHVILFATVVFNNNREIATSKSSILMLTNSMPAFGVNAFFVITGILTAYLAMRRSGISSTNPIKWIIFIFYRYLRLMPMYVLVTVYCKHIARYIGDGPYWDYGTSSSAARRICEQESWVWTLLLGANFKPLFQHCIPPAWYIANDFQFFLCTPILLALLQYKPKLGKILLVILALTGYLAGVWKIFSDDATDMRPIAEFMVYGYMVYANNLQEYYTHPQYRIPAYLVGLLLGYQLFEQEQKLRVHLEKPGESGKKETAPSWPEGMRRYGPLFAIYILFTTAMTPKNASFLGHMSPLMARIWVAFFNPTFNLMFSIGVGIYILLATTDHGSKSVNQFLSQSFWKPFARLGLCVMLINMEVIAYLVQTSRTAQYMDNYYLCSLNLMAFICTYLVALILHVLFESPIRALLNHIISFIGGNGR